MGWGDVTIFPRRPGETKRQAVARVYAGGFEIEFHDDGTASMNDLPGEVKVDHTALSRGERPWMTHAIDVLERLAPGWETVEEIKERGRRWRWASHSVDLRGNYLNPRNQQKRDLVELAEVFSGALMALLELASTG